MALLHSTLLAEFTRTAKFAHDCAYTLEITPANLEELKALTKAMKRFNSKLRVPVIVEERDLAINPDIVCASSRSASVARGLSERKFKPVTAAKQDKVIQRAAAGRAKRKYDRKKLRIKVKFK